MNTTKRITKARIADAAITYYHAREESMTAIVRFENGTITDDELDAAESTYHDRHDDLLNLIGEWLRIPENFR